MKPLSSLPLSATTANELAADSRSLDALRRDAARDPQQAVKSAARQFEAMFMQMVLKSMREATPKSGLFDSNASELYTGMLDQQMANRVAGSGTGLADMITRQLMRHMQAGAANGPAPASKAGAAVTADAVRTAYAVPAATTTRSAAAVQSEGTTAAGSGESVQRTFVNRMWDHALVAQRATGLPAKFIVGQAALESGWGRNEIKSADGLRSYNLFGIKATGGWQGRTVEVPTTEYENGVAVRKVEKFRAYNNYGEAFRDWSRLLATNPRYAEVLAQGADAAGFANGLQRAGYATDPNYGAKLRRVIETAQALRGVV